MASTELSYLRLVLDLDPTFERDKHDELSYPFGESGHRARDFRNDPYKSGAYAPTVYGSPINYVLPAISGGPPVVGKTLTVSTGSWWFNPTDFAFRWFANGNPIIGAVGHEYVPTVGDAGKMITAGVAGVNFPYGQGAEVITAAVGPVHTVIGGL